MTPKHLLPPLGTFKKQFCNACEDGEWCKPNQQRMLICALCAILNAISQPSKRVKTETK